MDVVKKSKYLSLVLRHNPAKANLTLDEHGWADVESVLSGFNGMSILDILEMLVDWRSAVRRHKNGDLCKSIEISQERFGYNDQQKSQLIKTAKELGLLEKENG